MLNPTVVAVIDSSGELEPWYESPDLWRLGAADLPPRFVHVGRDVATPARDRLLAAPLAGGALDKGALAAALTHALRSVSDAQATAQAMRAGQSVSERTTILLVMRSGDPFCESLPSVVHELHSVMARIFPGRNSQVVLTVLLPSLFEGSSDADNSRTYALLRWIDTATADTTAVRMYQAPRRPFQAVWLINAINENGHTVGQFPAAFESLTAFLHALLLGEIASPEGHELRAGPARCYGTFGCSVLTAEREALRDAVAATLYSDLLPRLFGTHPGTPEVAAREADRFVSASNLDRLESMVAADQDGTPLYEFRYLSWSRDTAKQTGTVLADLAAYRQDLDRMLHDVVPRMERRQNEIERDLRGALKAAAASRADSDGCQSVEWFLEALVLDPPEDADLLGEASRFTFFGLLGRAIDHLDLLIGFDEPRRRLARLQERLAALDEQRRTLEAEATVHEERISTARLMDTVEGADDAAAALAACRVRIDAVLAELHTVRAQHRGQVIADRSFHLGQRQTAVTQRRTALAEQVTQAETGYTASVASYREMAVALGELYERRRAWLIRTLAIPPVVAVVSLLLMATVPATPWTTIEDLIGVVADQATNLAAGAVVALLTYAMVASWIYWRKFATRVRRADRELRQQDDVVSMAADTCAKADRELTAFLFRVFQSDAAIRTLLAVRAHGRDDLLPGAKRFRAWVNEPITWTVAPPTLYRSSTWTANQVQRTLARALEGVPNIDAVFWATMGTRSSWVFLEPTEARARLDGFAALQFKRLGELTAEETLFHPRFGIESKRADQLVLSIDLAAAPYLQLQEADDTVSERIVLTAGGRQSPVHELLDRHQAAAKYPDFADETRIVIIRTRHGFTLRSMTELRTYWHAHLSDTARATPAGIPAPDLLSIADLGPYSDIARAFLSLWSAGRIVHDDAGYVLDGEWLCADRLRFYADCVADPEFRAIERRVLAHANGSAAATAIVEPRPDAALMSWERELVAKAAPVEAI